MAPNMDDGEDICRFCRSEATPDKPLFHPCVCAGSIKYIHQDCLVHWLKYSEKEYCELCNHRFSFTNIYSPDMPKRLPLSVLLIGIFKNSVRALQRWLHLALVTLAWGVLAPVIACRLYKFFLYDTPPSGIYGRLLELFTTSDIINDIFHGCCIVSCSMVAFISLAWLKDQIIRHGGPDWQEYRDIDTHHDDVDDDDESEEELAEERADYERVRGPQNLNNGIEGNENTITEEVYFDTNDTIMSSETTSNDNPILSNSLNSDAQSNTLDSSLSMNDRNPLSQRPTSPNATSTESLASSQSTLIVPTIFRSRNITSNHSSNELPTTSNYLPSQENTISEISLHQLAQGPSSLNDFVPQTNHVRVVEEAEPQDVEVNNDVNHNNWNNDWDINEDISWERIVGLDGSFVYVQHVFWVVCLNSLFILLFAFIPYNFGCFIVGLLGLKLYLSMAPFHGFITSVIGYLSIGILTVIVGAIASMAKIRRLARVMNFSYIIIRITIFLVFELGLLPFLCGWLLDLSTLPLVNGNIQERYNHLLTSAYMSTTIHWTLGFVYAFNFLLFVCLLKEVVKPKVLSLFYNFEDPAYNPMPEIIQESIWQFIRCFISITFLMTSSIFLVAYLPVRAIKYALPQFLPYVVTINNELTELTIEFFMLLLLFPTVVDYGNFRYWLTIVIRFWCIHVTRYLGLDDYLLNSHIIGPVIARETTSVGMSHPLISNNQFVSTTSGHQEQDTSSILRQEQRTEEQSGMDKKRYMIPKFIALAFIVALTLFSIGIMLVTLPAMIGRVVLGLWFGPKMKIHECNTISIGLFLCFIVFRLCTSLYSSLPLSFESVVAQTKRWIIITTKATIVTMLFLGLIPFLVGLIFDVTWIIPRRVGDNQTPIFYLWQDWVFGILLTKVIAVMLMLSPGRTREALEDLYQGGMANIRLKLVFARLAGPVIAMLGVYLSIPYIVANLLLPYLGVHEYTISAINRDMYGWLMYTGLGIILGSWQFTQFTQLHVNIRNERYMVGRRLVNYHR